VKAAAAPDAQAECHDLGIANVDAGRAIDAMGDDAPVRQGIDGRLFDPEQLDSYLNATSG